MNAAGRLHLHERTVAVIAENETDAARRDRVFAENAVLRQRIAELERHIENMRETMSNLVGTIESATGPNAQPSHTVNLIAVAGIARKMVGKQ